MPAFSQHRQFERARALAVSSLIGFGRRTVSGLITTCGQQFKDWSSVYRLFGCDRIDREALFKGVLRGTLMALEPNMPFVASMDDTQLKKSGKMIAGTSWRRDPLGPKFTNNLMWAQRFLQISASIPEMPGQPSRARAVPIDFLHCPSPRKPRKAAPESEWSAYRHESKRTRISNQGANQLWTLRRNLDDEPGGCKRQLIMTVDGSYTNATVLKHLPPRTTIIGRIRKDAKLNAIPKLETSPRRGRKRFYGDLLSTPDELLRNTSLKWQRVKAWAAGRVHNFRVKTLERVRWRKAGGQRDIRLVIVSPLGYRRSKQSRMLYRRPAYLICTDPELPLEQLLQYYIWRWEIEVNFRDEKSLLGLGQAQVRSQFAVETVPALIVAAYACLLLAARKTLGKGAGLPLPKWRRPRREGRLATQQAINLLRADLWGQALGVRNKSDFVYRTNMIVKSNQLRNSLASAVLFATG